MTPRLKREETKQNKNTLTKNALPIGVEMQEQTMSLEFNDLISPPVVAVNCDNRKAMGKKMVQNEFEKSTKNDNIEIRKKK